MFPRAILLGLLLCSSVSQGAVLFSTNTAWRFFRGTNEASLPDITAWRSNTFNDAAFVDAPAPFWFGDVRPGGTQLTDMQNNYNCFFLRKTFLVTNASQVGALRLTYFIDDGFVAWINGRELYRERVSDPITTNTVAAQQPIDPAPLTNKTVSFSGLLEGTNIIAVQVFNIAAANSDVGFDLQLDSIISDTVRPTVLSVNPPAGEVTALTNITVTFSESVTGVDATDFLISGLPASAVSGGGSIYTFSFPQPPYGLVQIGWDSAHNIMDTALFPNSFDANGPGATWQYQLVDRIGPTVTKLFPTPASTVRSLGQIDVTFSEDVSGVDAADLLINGVPATNVIAKAGGVYSFQFASPPAGTAQVAWANGHGITDLATTPNPFAGGSWQYLVDPNAAGATLVINEILVSNQSTNGLRDDDYLLQGITNQVDWIEIYNAGAAAVNLAGWSLSDDLNDPGLWVFPTKLLQPGEYLIVMASGKDIKNPVGTNHFHTNFKLSRAGDFLGLFSPDSPRALVSGFAPNYPEQRNDISYGHDSHGNLRFFATPTPGGPNGLSTIIDVAQPVNFSVTRGFFSNAFTLNLSTPTPNAQIRFTTDGSEPTFSGGNLYVQPLRITNTALIRAATFKTNFLSSRVSTHSYLFNLTPAQRTLPVISIVAPTNNLIGRTGVIGMSPDNGRTEGTAFTTNNPATDFHNPSQHGIAYERPVSAEFIRPEDNSGFQIDCGIRVQGSDWQRPRTISTSKFSFRLYFRGAYGPGHLDYPLFPLTTVQNFDQIVLRAGYNEKINPFIRDEITRRLASDMGEIASHGNMVLLLLNGGYHTNDPGGAAVLPIYNPCERVHEEMMQAHFGGGREWDVVCPDFATSSEGLGIVDGDRTDFNRLMTNVWTGSSIRPVVNQVDYLRVSKRLDLVNFVDYCMLNAYTAMGDWPANNWRAGRERNNPNAIWRFIAWDAEWAMGIYALPVTRDSFGFTGTGTDDAGLNSTSNSEIARLHQGLVANPEFRLLWADRIHKHFFNGGALSGGNITNRYNQLRTELLGFIPSMEVEILQWAQDRFPIIMSQFNTYGLYGYSNATFGVFASSNAPAFTGTSGLPQHGGRVPRGFALNMSAALGGQIYYTTNGDDPRVPFTGAVSNSAVAYSGAITLNDSTRVKARTLLNGTNWSAVADAFFEVATLGVPLRITEIMYNPIGGRVYEYIELQNVGPATLDLGGFTISDDIDYFFPLGTVLAAGARMVLANGSDPTEFANHYGAGVASGYFNGSLDNGGGRITVRDAASRIVVTVDFDDEGGWPTSPDGAGSSLEIVNPYGDPDDPANWRASAQIDGTPGAANSAASLPIPDVRLNELMADNLSAVVNGTTHPDWIELYNAGVSGVDLGGWSLTDGGNPRKFVFPPGTLLSSGGYLVVWCDSATNTTPGLHTDFALNRDGESIFLYNNSTSLVDAVSFGLQVADYSIGRISGSWELNVPTPNGANVGAGLGSATNLAINEWMANPAAGQNDWIELFNRSSSQPVGLRGLYLGTTGGVQQITSLSFLGPQGFAQLFTDEGIGASHVDLKLPSTGGSIILYDQAATEMTRVDYGLQIEGVSQGRLPDGNTNFVNFPGTPSPGTNNYLLNYGGPYLNEVLARNRSATTNSAGQVADWVELYNPTPTNFDLGGMSLSIDDIEPGQWMFPSNTVIVSGGYLVLWCDGSQDPSITTGPVLNTGRSLNGDSGGIYLFNRAGQTVNSIEYGFQLDNQSIGRVGAQLRLLATPTPGATNSAQATLASATNLVLNEWMARPASGSDWFEIYNNANLPVDMAGIYLTDDLSLSGLAKFKVAPLSFIGARGWVKWEADQDASKGRNHVNFDLDGDGESLRIYNTNGIAIDTIDFSAQAAGVSQGRLPDGGATIVNFTGSASPGESNYLPLDNALINEVLTRPEASVPAEQAVELYNPTLIPANIGGWFLSDNRTNYAKYRIPDGTTIPPGGYVMLYQNQFGGNFTFDSAVGGEVILSSADPVGNLTGGRSYARFGAAAIAVSFGRFVTSLGVDFTAMAQRSFGASNSYPEVGPVVISELMYHPLPWSTNIPGVDGEYIELHNRGGLAVSLYDVANPGNRWRLANGVDFTFPTNLSVPAGGDLLVVNFDPAIDAAALAQFRNQYGLSPSVPIVGPYRGRLDNGGEQVELYMPDAPLPPGGPHPGFVPYLLVDVVNYSDAPPWPSGAVDGGGLSLQRRSVNLYGNEPLNWIAAAPTPGAANGSGVVPPPVVTVSPANQVASEDSTVSLTVAATGFGPLSYQWRHNGINLDDGTNSALVIKYAQLSDEGVYDAFVSNAGGSTRSGSARLSVPVPPTILAVPQNQTVSLSNSISFNVIARGSAPLFYQWSLNGTPIASGNSPTLFIGAAQIADAGDYTVTVTNAFGSVSATATLVVSARPVVTENPQSLLVALGTPVTLRAGARASPGPVNFSWRRNFLTVTNSRVSNAVSAVYTALYLTDATTNGVYAAVITNVAGLASGGPQSGFTSNAYLTVIVPPTNQSVAMGSSATFNVSQRGQSPVRYQWQFNSANLSNATNATLVLNNVQPAQAGTYGVVATMTTNSGSVVFSASNAFTATLQVTVPAPTLTSPQLATNGSFKMLVQAVSNLNYAVEISSTLSNWSVLSTFTATNSVHPFTDATATNAGQRFYRARFVPQ